MKKLLLFFIVFYGASVAIAQQTDAKTLWDNFGKKSTHKAFSAKKDHRPSVVKKHAPMARTATMMLQLDSLIMFNDAYYGAKLIFNYDPSQNTLTGDNYNIDLSATSTWNYGGQGTLVFDANGYETLNSFSIWNTVSNQLVPWTKVEYTYNANYDITLRIESNWDTIMNQWVYAHKSENTYTANNDISLNLEYDWDINTGQWEYSINGAKTAYFYNGSNRLDTTIFYTWDNLANQFKYVRKDVFIYDANNYLVTNLIYGLNVATQQWVYSTKYEYTNDNAGNPLTEIHYSWDTFTSQWYEETKYITTFNANNQETSTIYQTFNDSTSLWQSWGKDESTYDANGNYITNKFYPWDNINSQWGNYENYDELTYDINYTYNDVYVPHLINFVFDDTPFNVPTPGNVMLSVRQDELNGNIWNTFYELHLYYSLNNINAISDTHTQKIKVYPNPTDGILMTDIPFDNATLNIRDMQGREVLTKNLNKYEQTSLHTLATGIYLCRISSDNYTYNFKLVVR